MQTTINENHRLRTEQLTLFSSFFIANKTNQSNTNIFTRRKSLYFYMSIKYNIIVGTERGDKMTNKKMGRPLSQDPKNIRVNVYLTQKESEVLDNYCEKKDISRAQGLRDGIQTLDKK